MRKVGGFVLSLLLISNLAITQVKSQSRNSKQLAIQNQRQGEVISQLRRWLQHYAVVSQTAKNFDDFFSASGIVVNIRDSARWEGSFPSEVTTPFFIVVVPPAFVDSGKFADFNDSTLLLRIHTIPETPIVCAAQFIHELQHAYDRIHGHTLGTTAGTPSSILDEIRAYETELRFLDEVTRGYWSRIVEIGLRERQALFPDRPSRVTNYDVFSRADSLKLQSVFRPRNRRDLGSLCFLLNLDANLRHIRKRFEGDTLAIQWKRVEVARYLLDQAGPHRRQP